MTARAIQEHLKTLGFYGGPVDGVIGPLSLSAIAKALGLHSSTASYGFSYWLPHILAHEGGYVNHPKDPGGATNKGITQATYDAWRLSRAEWQRSVKDITNDEVAAIYRREYWDRVKGDDLPNGLAYAVFDFAVNSGVSRASKFLQAALGVTQDGKIGPATIAAARDAPEVATINKLCDARMAFLRSLSTFATFGKGWTRRVEDVRAKASEAA